MKTRLLRRLRRMAIKKIYTIPLECNGCILLVLSNGLIGFMAVSFCARKEDGLVI